MPTKRVTLLDIADRAGVTKAAVSFALNGAPGVSAATRERVRKIAAELGYQPNVSARALKRARSNTVGIVIDRAAGTIGAEPFFLRLIAGIQSVLAREHVSLLFTLTEDPAQEIEVYRAWWAQSRVDGVLVVDVKVSDPRIEALNSIGTPAVYIGATGPKPTESEVAFDDGASMREVVEFLAGIGHRSIARVSGMTDLAHTGMRDAAMRRAARRLGLDLEIVRADYSAASGVRATSQLLLRERRPTAIIYDNDVMALAGLGALTRAGLKVPRDMSIIAWDDSVMCELANPAITALHRDVEGHGALAAARLLEVLGAADRAPTGGSSGRLDWRLLIRESTAAPRSRRR